LEHKVESLISSHELYPEKYNKLNFHSYLSRRCKTHHFVRIGVVIEARSCNELLILLLVV